MVNIILFGPPGSGKGTQAAKLVEKYDLLHISTGDLFRANIGGETELGMKAKAFMDKGELVPDSLTIEMLKAKVDENPNVKGYIFDGFPRTIPQAEALDAMLSDKGQEVNYLLALDVVEGEIIKRLLKRGEVSGRSDDQNEDVIKNRIGVYIKNTRAVAEYYNQLDKTNFIDGMGTIEEIFDRLCKVLDSE